MQESARTCGVLLHLIDCVCVCAPQSAHTCARTTFYIPVCRVNVSGAFNRVRIKSGLIIAAHAVAVRTKRATGTHTDTQILYSSSVLIHRLSVCVFVLIDRAMRLCT